MLKTRAKFISFNLASLMRQHHVSIRELSSRMGVPMVRIRKVRTMARVEYMTYCDYYQAVTGLNVFTRDEFQSHYR